MKINGRRIYGLVCCHGRRMFTSAPASPTSAVGLAVKRPERIKGSHLEYAFLSAMEVRERYLALSARATPDDYAKDETMKMAAAGKEHPAVAAFRAQSLGFGFSAGGFLFPYFVGAAGALADLQILTPGSTPLAGSSAGSLIAACVSSGLTPAATMAACSELAADLRAGGTFRRMGPVLERVLHAHLPDNAHVRCSGCTFVGITRAFPYARSEVISEFHTKEDLIQSLLTSCHIPFYFSGTLSRSFRGALAYDGGVTNFIPVPPGESAAYSARVCCFPSQNLSSVTQIHVSPDSFDDTWSQISLSRLLSWALVPASDTVLQKLFDKGRADAVAWAALTGVMDAAAPDSDDWYCYNLLHDAAAARPPIMGNGDDIVGSKV